MIVSKPILEPEKAILRVKYAGLQFGKMKEQNLWAYAKATLLKIHVITGWTIPGNELMEILLDQFIKKIIETYPNTNPEEWEYAFRNYGTGVKDWGKSMNLSLIDEVMGSYLTDRKELSHELEERKDPPPMKFYSDEELDNLHRSWAEEYYQQIRKGLVKEIPDVVRAILVKDKLIEDGGKADEFFVIKLENKAENIYRKVL